MYKNTYVSSIMSMKADVYEQENTQDSISGTLTRHWELRKTVKCHIQPTKSDGSSIKSDGKFYNTDNKSYIETSQLRGKFMIPLSKRWRISNIRSSNNIPVFNEMDPLVARPTAYEVVSCHPMLDPFGRLSHYDVTLERVQVQNNDSY